MRGIKSIQLKLIKWHGAKVERKSGQPDEGFITHLFMVRKGRPKDNATLYDIHAEVEFKDSNGTPYIEQIPVNKLNLLEYGPNR
jgi:hypothetical protein